MDSFKDVLEAAQAYCKTQMAEPTYNLYIDGLEPISFEDSSHITLSVRNDFICKIVTDRYLGLLKEAFKTVLGFDVDITLVVPSTPPHEVVLAQQYEANPASPQGNYEFTFENFIKGPSNQFAFAAAQAVAANPSGAYNPLFIYGGVGLGKTHLMHAIGHFINEENPAARVMYVTSETFTNELITAIQQDKRLEFRKRYRSVDILLIDDVQFISKSQATQEEFFNTFNTLHNANKQIVISSDRPPKEIAKLEERLCSRFQWGLITDIQPPDIETRIAILRNRARIDNIEVGDDVLQFIADHVQSNIRELEGCLTRVVAFSRLRRRPLNLEVTAEALKDLLPDVKKREVTPQLIKQTVAEFYSISVESMDSQRRDREVVMPRQIAMYLCHRMLSLPYKRIAYLFGRNDHTTAMSACDKIDKMIAEDARFASVIEDLKKRM